MSRLGLIIYLVAMVCSAAIIVLRFADGVPLETNILALLPESDSAEWVQRAQSVQQSRGSDQLIVLVGHTDFDTAKAAARSLKSDLLQNQIILQGQRGTVAGGYQELAKVLFPYREGLLTEEDRLALAAGKGREIANRALGEILSPLSYADADVIRKDPLLLFPHYLSHSQRVPAKLQPQDGVLAIQEGGKWYVLVVGTLAGAAFDKDFQEKTRLAFENTEADLVAKNTDLVILKTGAVFYGDHAYRQAEKEASLIGGISLLAILILNLLVFRSLRPLLMSLLAIASGIIGGLAVTLLFFGKLHLLALVFGASLIGIAVDYAFHYFCERFQPDMPLPEIRAKAIRSGLTLGLVSSVLGFLTLSLTPFPGLQQIALFSASGLTLAYLTVLYVFPRIDQAKAGGSAETLLNASMVLYNLWWQGDYRKIRIAVGTVIVLFSLFGAFKITIDDDVRRLQSLPEDLQAEEQQIRQLAGIGNQTYQLLLQGNTSDEVLRLEEDLKRDLGLLKNKGVITDFEAVSDYVPSAARQRENKELVADNLFPLLNRHLTVLGMRPGNPYEGQMDVATVEHIIQSEAALSVNRLVLLNSPGVFVHAISLRGVRESKPLVELADRSENVVLSNQAEGLSETFGTYRLKSLVMLAIAYVVVWVFLSLRYGIGGALQVIAPSLGAVLIAPCLLALFGETFTFFNAISLMLVFAIGLDYALFNRESSGPRKNRSMLANGLSAVSTILAFGLLGLSETYAIHAFGVTIFAGILLAYCLAPIASDIQQEEPETL